MSKQAKFTAEAFGDEIASKPVKSKVYKQDSQHQSTNPTDTPLHLGKHDSASVIQHQLNGTYTSDSIADNEMEAFIGWDTVKNTKKEKARKRKSLKAAEQAQQQDNKTDITDLTQQTDAADNSTVRFADNVTEIQNNESSDNGSVKSASPTPQQQSNESDKANAPVRGLSNAANNILTPAADSITQTANTVAKTANDAAAQASTTVQSVVDTVINSADDLSKLITDILSTLPDKTLPLAQIGDRVTALTKQSWSKAYKKQFGSLRDFVTSRAEQFKLLDDDKLTIRVPDVPQSATKAKKKKKKNKTASTTIDEDTAAEVNNSHSDFNGTSVQHTIDNAKQQTQHTVNEASTKAEQTAAHVIDTIKEQTKPIQQSLPSTHEIKQKTNKINKKLQKQAINGKNVVHDTFDELQHTVQNNIHTTPQQTNVLLIGVSVVAIVLIGVTVMKYI